MGERYVVLCLLVGCGSVNQTTPDAAVDAKAVDAPLDAATMATINVTRAGNSLGRIVSDPPGIDCGTTCTGTFRIGTVVTLMATMPAGGVGGWSGGGCPANGLTCSVLVTGNADIGGTLTCPGSPATLNFSGAIVAFTVPACAPSVTIDAFGASGGNSNGVLGGLGAEIKGTVEMPGPLQFRVLVGGRGFDATGVSMDGGASGGGGTFVATPANVPVIVAGGGGGATFISSGGSANSPGLGGVVTNDGSAGNDPNAAQIGCAAGPCMPGGTNGGGGFSSQWNGWHGGAGGGGFTGNGVNVTGGNSTFGTPNNPGTAFVNGGAGGVPGTQQGAHPGGFGGGGSAGASGGGGGGYSGGGAGGDYNYGGGGGGSFNSGTSPVNTAGVNNGNGKVVFTW